jgi:hypothetical protein
VLGAQGSKIFEPLVNAADPVADSLCELINGAIGGSLDWPSSLSFAGSLLLNLGTLLSGNHDGLHKQ